MQVDKVICKVDKRESSKQRENHALVSKHPLPNNIREDSTHGHHQMVNTEIRLIILFAAKYGDALSSEKQDQKLTVAQTMNFLLTNSYLD